MKPKQAPKKEPMQSFTELNFKHEYKQFRVIHKSPVANFNHYGFIESRPIDKTLIEGIINKGEDIIHKSFLDLLFPNSEK